MIVALRQSGEAHAFDAGEPHSRLVDRADGQPLRPLEIHAADGRAVGPDDTVVEHLGQR